MNGEGNGEVREGKSVKYLWLNAKTQKSAGVLDISVYPRGHEHRPPLRVPSPTSRPRRRPTAAPADPPPQPPTAAPCHNGCRSAAARPRGTQGLTTATAALSESTVSDVTVRVLFPSGLDLFRRVRIRRDDPVRYVLQILLCLTPSLSGERV